VTQRKQQRETMQTLFEDTDDVDEDFENSPVTKPNQLSSEQQQEQRQQEQQRQRQSQLVGEYSRSTFSSRLQQKERSSSHIIGNRESPSGSGINQNNSNKKSSSKEKSLTPPEETDVTEEEDDVTSFPIDPSSCRFNAQPLPIFPTIPLSDNTAPARLLAHANLISPAYSEDQRLLVTSNLSEIFVESIDSSSPTDSSASSQFFLLPYDLLRGGSLSSRVQELSISSNGQFIAAIISRQQNEDQGENKDEEDKDEKETSGESELHVWEWSASRNQCIHLEAVSLNSTQASSSNSRADNDKAIGPLIEWTHDNALLLLVPVAIPPSALENFSHLSHFSSATSGSLLSILCWGEDMEDIFQIAMPGRPLLFPASSSCSPPEKISSVPNWSHGGDCAILMKFHSKLALYVVGSAADQDILVPLWISVSSPFSSPCSALCSLCSPSCPLLHLPCPLLLFLPLTLLRMPVPLLHSSPLLLQVTPIHSTLQTMRSIDHLSRTLIAVILTVPSPLPPTLWDTLTRRP
jgi:hypothetical protein